MIVGVLTLHGILRMFVLVPLGDVEVQAKRHQYSRRHKLRRQRVMKEPDRNDGADKRCDREVSSSARSANMTKRQDEQDETNAVSKETYKAGRDHRR